MRSSQGFSPDLDFLTISSIPGKPCDVYVSRDFAYSLPTVSSDEPQIYIVFMFDSQNEMSVAEIIFDQDMSSFILYSNGSAIMYDKE